MQAVRLSQRMVQWTSLDMRSGTNRTQPEVATLRSTLAGNDDSAHAYDVIKVTLPCDLEASMPCDVTARSCDVCTDRDVYFML